MMENDSAAIRNKLVSMGWIEDETEGAQSHA